RLAEEARRAEEARKAQEAWEAREEEWAAAAAEERAETTQSPVNPGWTLYQQQVENARYLRRLREDEVEPFEDFLSKYGLSKEMAVRLATLFLIAVLSVVYVSGRNSSAAGTGVSGDDAANVPTAGAPSMEGVPESDSGEETQVPTGGGDFQNTTTPTGAQQEGQDSPEPSGEQ
ncbi:MAG: hypothetical protein Q4D81_14355, partial [Eubacteriales bacterium]|nr:hypothetical protein [Eubacteriales bacterium]